MATAERTELAGLLATLTLEQWVSPSLCARWRIRDVVAHVMSFDGLTVPGVLRRAVQGRLVNINQVAVDELASLDPDDLLDRLRSHLRPQGVATIFGGRLSLIDIVIHHQDIRRPLGLPRHVPVERLRRVLPDSLHTPELPGWHLTRGVRLTPTDLDWSHGRGPHITGSAEAILMAAAGRLAAVHELSGPGQPVLARRIARRRTR